MYHNIYFPSWIRNDSATEKKKCILKLAISFFSCKKTLYLSFFFFFSKQPIQNFSSMSMLFKKQWQKNKCLHLWLVSLCATWNIPLTKKNKNTVDCLFHFRIKLLLNMHESFLRFPLHSPPLHALISLIISHYIKFTISKSFFPIINIKKTKKINTIIIEGWVFFISFFLFYIEQCEIN